MKKIEAKIITDSMSPQKHRIITFHLTFPRHILAELNTHRMFSRNSASSRAIPFARMVKMVKEDPFIPIAWQEDHSGMQGKKYLAPGFAMQAEREWLMARTYQVSVAEQMSVNTHVTKQIVNRLLEPFMWHSNLVTSTEWENFFVQRCPQYDIGDGSVHRSKKDAIKHMKGRGIDTFGGIFVSELEWIMASKSPAEIHMQALAEAMWDAMNESTPNQLKAGEWHLPFGDNMDEQLISQHLTEVSPDWYNRNFSFTENIMIPKVKVSSARCARTSYNNFDGTSDSVKDIKLAEGLQADRHRSPLEHAAKCPTEKEYYEVVKGKVLPTRKTDDLGRSIFGIEENSFGWFNNFHGWIPYRYMIEEEERIGK